MSTNIVANNSMASSNKLFAILKQSRLIFIFMFRRYFFISSILIFLNSNLLCKTIWISSCSVLIIISYLVSSVIISSFIFIIVSIKYLLNLFAMSVFSVIFALFNVRFSQFSVSPLFVIIEFSNRHVLLGSPSTLSNFCWINS